MPEPRWLWRALLDAMHRELVEEHGGLYGARDDGLIDSALARAHNRWSYEPESTDLAAIGAAYGYGLARNHGYLDGNKRIALAAIHMSAWINGYEMVADEADEVAMMVQLASGAMPEAELADWIRPRLAPRPDEGRRSGGST